ncbi:MAG: class C sortase [Patescibacteria group bacterium]|nr:MAG: class C sortase [Patescibacteria group bacterium]
MFNTSKKQPKIMQSDLIELYRKALRQGTSVEEIEKRINHHLKRLRVSEYIEEKEDKIRETVAKRKIPKVIRIGAFILPVLFLVIGLYLVGSAVVPIVSSYFNQEELQVAQLAAPIPQDQVMDVTPLVISKQSGVLGSNSTEVEIVDEELDYTNLTNWFAGGALPQLQSELQNVEITEYILDIPKLEIENAVVKVGGTDLNKSLLHFSGTALPGQPGAPVIFGHSVLRQFYNPSVKNPRRYNSIFSTIMTLKNGDEIFVTADGVRYTYIVNNKTEVKPEDVYILTQKYDAKQLKLVTCTPEGTYLRRGIVTAQLVE